MNRAKKENGKDEKINAEEKKKEEKSKEKPEWKIESKSEMVLCRFGMFSDVGSYLFIGNGKMV